MNNGFINAYDIITYGALSPDFYKVPTRALFRTEQYLFNKYIGKDLYTDMRNALADYSSAATYDNTTAYTISTVVKYNGIYYKCKSPSTGNIPTDTTYWELAPRFTNIHYEELWCLYLAEYITWRVLADQLPTIVTELGASGATKAFGAHFRPADDSAVRDLQKAYFKRAQETWYNMEYYIFSHAEAASVFKNFKPILDSGTSDYTKLEPKSANDSNYGYSVG